MRLTTILKILDTASAGTVQQVSSSDESSDGDDDDAFSSLITVRPPVRLSLSPPVHLPVHPPRAEPLPVVPTRDFSDDEEEDQFRVGELLSKAIKTIGGTKDQIHQNNDSIQSQEMVATELRLVRTILERLECAYAIQEAKLDRLLNMMPNAPAVLQQPLQFQPSFPPTQSSTPIQSNIPQSNSSVEYRAPETGSSALPVIQRFVDDTSTSGNDPVTLGGSGGIRLSSQDFQFAKAAHKPTTMALRLADALFSKETLMCSTVHGTRDYAPLDQQIIAAIKAEVITSFAYQCRTTEDTMRMWESCKTLSSFL